MAATEFLRHVFTGTNGANLSTLSSTTGGPWTDLNGGATGTSLVVTGGNTLTNTGTGVEYVNAALPATADCDVTLTLTYSNFANMNLGMFAAYIDLNNYYNCLISGGAGGQSQIILAKTIGGVTSNVSTQNVTLVNGCVYALTYRKRGTVVSVLLNGYQIISLPTENSLPLAGKFGINSFQSSGGPYVAISSIVGTNAPTGTIIQPNDASWVTSPLNWEITSSRARSVNPGAYRYTNVTGTSSAWLNVGFPATTLGYPGIAARWDGGNWTPIALSNPRVQLPNAPSTGQHQLEIAFQRVGGGQRWTNPLQVADIFLLELDPGATVSTPTPKQIKIGVFRDSTGEGAQIYSANGTGDDAVQDATLAAPFLLRGPCNAEVGIVAFSGQAVTNINNQGTSGVPAAPDSYTLLYASGPTRSFTGIDIFWWGWGQNDSSGVAATFATDLEAIINAVKTANPTAKHFVSQDYRNVCPVGESTTASALGIPYLDGLSTLISSNTNSPSTLNPAYSWDGNHPNQAGTALILPPVVAQIQSMLPKPIGTSSTTLSLSLNSGLPLSL